MKRYTVVGAYTGMVLRTGTSVDDAVSYAFNNGFIGRWREAQAALEGLAVGAAWKSHEDARGIKITRIA